MSENLSTPRALFRQLAPNLTVFTSSAAIMLMQLVASRLIAQHVGQSLYTWTGIIGITLAGIALGNDLGGRIADRSFRRRTLGVLFLAAAAAELSVLALNPLAGAIPFAPGTPWPFRVVIHITLVYLLPFTALGTISPLIARRALHLGARTGRTIGDIYAWSIGGSIVGTFITGYYLMGLAGNQTLVIASAAVLAAVGLLYVLRDRGAESGFDLPNPAEPDAQAWRMGALALPIATAFLASAGLMAIELVASRLLARTFGQSLYTWTTIIGVILAGLTFGGALGGRLADRVDKRRLLARLFAAAAITTLLIAPLNTYLRNFPLLWNLPWTTHILCNCLIIYFIPALLLGMIPPVAVHMALDAGCSRGRTVGTVYAWGSIGSILGTFATGLLLIDLLGTINVLIGVTLLCALLAVYYAPRAALTQITAAIALIAVAAVSIPWAPLTRLGQSTALKPYHGPEVFYTDESSYSYIMIYTNDLRFPNVRSFALDKLVHSIVDINDPKKLHYPYEWYYAAVLDRRLPAGAPITGLILGGGGYAFPHYLEATRPESYIETVEIDPAVTEGAHAAFGLPRDTRVSIYNMDARNRVADLIEQKARGENVPVFDYVFGDSINDYSVPFHLTTQEFTEDIHTLLSDDGVYLLNLIDLYTSGQFLGSVINTCKAVFPHVYAFSSDGKLEQRDTFIVVSSKQPLDLNGIAEAVNAEHPGTGLLLSDRQLSDLAARTGGRILTDNFAPVDNLLAPVVAFSQEVFTTRRLVRADQFLQAGDVPAALVEIQAALDKDPVRPEAWDMLGNAHWQSNDAAAAEAAYRHSMEVAPHRWPPYLNLGLTKIELKQWDEAIALLERAVSFMPGLADAHAGLGIAYFNMGKLDDGVTHLRAAVAADPARTDAWINLGGILYTQGKIEEAVGALEQAVALQPQNGAAQEQRATAYWRLQRYDEAWLAVQAAQAAGHTVNPDFLNALRKDSGRQQ
ncbi:MAG: fused MFS/spermidine synthase [Candidatus Hydrogenedentes bacterium]|nr:fused MFS/spermidine synthase [Candidatus Hydrogenedentota bacterium]